MKLQVFVILALTVCFVACSRDEPSAPESADASQATAPASSTPPKPKRTWESEAFLAHMHRHAQQLDKLVLALAEGDFDAAMTPAYWLSRHEQVTGLPEEWQPWLDGVRTAAREVESAEDFESARAAAERITIECQGCHAASNVDPEAES